MIDDSAGGSPDAVSGTLMVVDDSEFVARLMKRMVDGSGFSVICHAKNGREALNLYQQFQPNIVIMDIIMPDMGGIEAIRELQKIDPLSRILVVSAMGHENIVEQAIDLGARHYILKPFKQTDLLAAIRLVASA